MELSVAASLNMSAVALTIAIAVFYSQLSEESERRMSEPRERLSRFAFRSVPPPGWRSTLR